MEELIEAGCEAGLSPAEAEDWTWGEILLLVQSRERALRRQYQALSVIAWHHALITAGAVCGRQPEAVYREFPFWEQEEQNRLAAQDYRAMMERLAGRGGEQRG